MRHKAVHKKKGYCIFPTSFQDCNNNDEKYSQYSTNKIIEAYQQQAKTSYQAIDMFAICEITDGIILLWKAIISNQNLLLN